MSITFVDTQEKLNLIRVPVADAVDVPIGSLIAWDGSTATVFASATDNSTFLGISHTKKVASDGQLFLTVDVGHGTYRSTVASASYAALATLRYVDTALSLGATDDTPADTDMIAVAAETKASTTTLLVKFFSRILIDAIGV